ncbi:MAG TPA: undecaprenyldiphospho-muramoylpentapeptide beta-N-acetylglucosaminyltransferase [Halanaerobiales bacterium]|nr:undecaprenyldiphospho-muramoylpentapeptide beta-N-acetylglucosaminyltransferase [Halanaerobiales bacterium]
MKKAIISGGGTGGHIYPALAVARQLIEKGWEILYVGSETGLEKKIVSDEGFNFREICVAPLPRGFSIRIFNTGFKTVLGLLQSIRIINEYQPELVLGTGGFVAGPVVLAASLRGVPTIIHEQNVYPGLTNKLLSYFVDKIALNFAEADKYFPVKAAKKMVTSGNPVREIILNTTKEEGLRKFGFNSRTRTLLVFGGSQGSKSINSAMLELYDYYQHSRDIQIIHLTGDKNFKFILKELEKKGIDLSQNRNYKIMPYLSEIQLAYAVADLVIYRAGATGIAEITARGIPAILIPYPYSAEGHQEYNARTLEMHGAAFMISDKKLNGKLLIKKVEELINDKEKLKKMAIKSKKLGKPDATQKLVELIEEITLDFK